MNTLTASANLTPVPAAQALIPAMKRDNPFDAAQIDTCLNPQLTPTVVLMNPPFSAFQDVRGIVRGAAMKPIRIALHWLAPSGRLVVIAGSLQSPDEPTWRRSFLQLQPSGRGVFSAAFHGRAYPRHSTTVEIRLTVIDKIPTHDRSLHLASYGGAPDGETLTAWVASDVPPRPPTALAVNRMTSQLPSPARAMVRRLQPSTLATAPQKPSGADLASVTADPSIWLSKAPYEPYRLMTLSILRANPQPAHMLSLAEILEPAEARTGVLLVNKGTGQACMQYRVWNLFLDNDGEEKRVVLMGSNSEHFTSLQSMGDSVWKQVERSVFMAAWENEVAAIPELFKDTIHVVSGLLLQIQSRLQTGSVRAYRRETNDEERIVGRWVFPAWLATASAVGGVYLRPADPHTVLMEGPTVLPLAYGLQLRRVRACGSSRIELSGFTDHMTDRPKALGVIRQIVTWKLRLLVPMLAEGVKVLARVLQACPIEQVSAKEPV